MTRNQLLMVLAGLLGLCLILSLPFVLEDEKPVIPVPEAKEEPKPEPEPEPPVLTVPVPVPVIPEIRRPIAGARDQVLIIAADGSSWLEKDGKRTLLVTAAPVPALAPKAIPLPPTEVDVPSQLIILEKGVVQIPAGALITLLDDDHVVTHDPGGDTVAYWADGRVERRSRFPRAMVMPKSPPLPKPTTPSPE